MRCRIGMMGAVVRPVVWMGTSREDLRGFPPEVRRDIGQAFMPPSKATDPAAKPLKGFGGARVMEIVDRHAANTHRAVYTVQFAGRIYVLHAVQKKSKKGIATPQKDIELVRQRLAAAERHDRERQD